jgi:hypothetical protein
MSVQTERLERAAAEERERLGEHLGQLQHRLENALDPAAFFDRYPLPILATALVGGVVLGAVTRSDGPARRLTTPEFDRSARRGGGIVSDSVAHLRGAVVSMALAKLADMAHEFTSARAANRPARRPQRPAAHADGSTGVEASDR